MHGLDRLVAGWLAHLFHAAVLGVVFAALAGAAGISDTRAKSAGVGIAYGVVLAAIAMPVWLGAAGFPGAPPLPNFDSLSLVGHLVYGAVLGAAYPSVADL